MKANEERERHCVDCCISERIDSLSLLVHKLGFRHANVFRGGNVAELRHALAVPGFVVVPGVDFDHGTVNDLRAGRVDDAAAGVVGVVGADERGRFEPENAPEWAALGGRLQGGVDLFHRDGLVDFKDAVRQTGVGEGHANGEAVELAFEFGVDFDNGRGGTSAEANVFQEGLEFADLIESLSFDMRV